MLFGSFLLLLGCFWSHLWMLFWMVFGVLEVGGFGGVWGGFTQVAFRRGVFFRGAFGDGFSDLCFSVFFAFILSVFVFSIWCEVSWVCSLVMHSTCFKSQWKAQLSLSNHPIAVRIVPINRSFGLLSLLAMALHQIQSVLQRMSCKWPTMDTLTTGMIENEQTSDKRTKKSPHIQKKHNSSNLSKPAKHGRPPTQPHPAQGTQPPTPQPNPQQSQLHWSQPSR